jgi:hypothetical protein
MPHDSARGDRRAHHAGRAAPGRQQIAALPTRMSDQIAGHYNLAVRTLELRWRPPSDRTTSAPEWQTGTMAPLCRSGRAPARRPYRPRLPHREGEPSVYDSRDIGARVLAANDASASTEAAVARPGARRPILRLRRHRAHTSGSGVTQAPRSRNCCGCSSAQKQVGASHVRANGRRGLRGYQHVGLDHEDFRTAPANRASAAAEPTPPASR